MHFMRFQEQLRVAANSSQGVARGGGQQVHHELWLLLCGAWSRPFGAGALIDCRPARDNQEGPQAMVPFREAHLKLSKSTERNNKH